jgi:hypothetical protein
MFRVDQGAMQIATRPSLTRVGYDGSLTFGSSRH